MPNKDVFTAAIVYGDRYTTGSDNQRDRDAKNLIAQKRQQQFTNKQQLKRLRDLAREFPYMSEGGLTSIAQLNGLLTTETVAPIAYADVASMALGGKFGATGRDSAPQGTPQSASNPRGTAYLQSREDLGVVDEQGQSNGPTGMDRFLRTLTGTGIATLATPLYPVYDALWRRPGGVRQEVEYFADKYKMDEPTKVAFAERVGQSEQMSPVDMPGNNLFENATFGPLRAMAEAFLPDDPRNPANRADIDLSKADMGKVEAAVAHFFDPATGYKGRAHDEDGPTGLAFVDRNWWASPLGQMVNFGGWGESWVGNVEANRKRIEEFHGYEYDLRNPAERKEDERQLNIILTNAQRDGMLNELDPERLFSVYGPRAGTMGKYVAEYEMGLDPRTSPYRFISGTIDLAGIAVLDPVNYVPGVVVTKAFKGAANATHRAALATPGVRAFTPAARAVNGSKTAVFETARMMRNAIKHPNYVQKTASGLTPTGMAQDARIAWDVVDGTAFPVREDGSTMFTHGVQFIDKWESAADGGRHALIRDPVTGNMGYVGPLDIVDQPRSARELQDIVLNQLVPDLVDETPTGMIPVPGNVTGVDDTVGMVRVSDLMRLKKQPTSDLKLDPIKQSVADEGVTNPITVMYNPDTGMAYIGEGNHRLVAALQSGKQHVPVRVVADRGIGEYGAAYVRAFDDAPEIVPGKLGALDYGDPFNPKFLDFAAKKQTELWKGAQPGDVRISPEGLPVVYKGADEGWTVPEGGRQRFHRNSAGDYEGRLFDNSIVYVRKVGRSHGKDRWQAFKGDMPITPKVTTMKEVRAHLDQQRAEAIAAARQADVLPRPPQLAKYRFPGGVIEEQADGSWVRTLDADVENMLPTGYKTESGSTYRWRAEDELWRRMERAPGLEPDASGKLVPVGGFGPPAENTAWVLADEADQIAAAAEKTRRAFSVADNGDLTGVTHVKGPDWNQAVFDSAMKEGAKFDDAFTRAGGKVETVTITPQRTPGEGLRTVQWSNDGKQVRVGSQIREVKTGTVKKQTRFDTGDEAVTAVTDDFLRENSFHRNAEWVVVDRDGNRVKGFGNEGEARDYAMRESGFSPDNPESYLTSQQVDDFYRFTAPGQQIIDKLWELKDNPARIWRLSGKKIDKDTCLLISKVNTKDDLLSVMGTRTGTHITDDVALTRLIGLRGKSIESVYRLEAKSKTMRAIMRLGALAPRETTMRMDDGDEVLEQMWRWGKGLGHPMETTVGKNGKKIIGIEEYMNAYMRLMDDPGMRYAIFNSEGIGFWDNVARGAMERAGVPSDVARTASRAFKRRTKDQTKGYKSDVLPEKRIVSDNLDSDMFPVDYDLNAITDNRIGEGTWIVGGADDIPIFLDEAMRMYMPVPSYKNIRRQVNLLSTVLRKMPKGESLQAIHTTTGELLNRWTSLWRDFTLMNPAYAVRNIMEEQFRMGLAGDSSVFTNPLEAISTAVTIAATREASNRTGKALQSMMLLGMPNLARRVTKQLEDPTTIFMVKRNVFEGAFTVPEAGTKAVVNGKQVSGGRLATSLRRSGPSEPIVVAYDPARQMWRVKDGNKRLAAWDAMPGAAQPGYVPVRIVEEAIPDGVGVAVPKAVSTKVVATPRRAKPLLEVDDTLHKATPDHLFGKGMSEGRLSDLIAKGQDNLRDLNGLNALLTYTMPMFRHKFAFINGDEWNQAHNAAINGNWDDVSDRITRMSTLAGGGWLNDDAANRVRALGVVTRERDMLDYRGDYVRMLALRHKQLSDLPHVKHLYGRYNLEQDLNVYIDDLMERDPDGMRSLLSLLEGSTKDDSLADLVQRGMDNLSNGRKLSQADRAAVRNILGAQLETAWEMGGKGASQDIMEAIHTGVYKGRRIGDNNPEYIKLLENTLGDDALRVSFPQRLTGYAPASWSHNKTQWLQSRKGKLTEWFFNTAGETRDLMTASPMMRMQYADEVVKLVPHMTMTARRRVLQNLRAAGDRKLADKVRRAMEKAPSELGWLDPDSAHLMASMRAVDHLKKTFYDAGERRNWALAMRILVPFGQAQMNTLAVWGKLLLDRPVDAYRTMRPINAVRNEWTMTSYDLLNEMYGSPGTSDEQLQVYEPFLTYDGDGSDRYVMPVYGPLAKLVGVEAHTTGTFDSLNLAAGGVVPGTGPVVSIPAAFFADRLLNSPTFQGDIARTLWKYPLPKGSAADKIMGGLMPGKWQDGMMLAGDPTNPEFVKKTMGVLQQVMATGTNHKGEPFNPNDPGDLEEALAIAESRARKLLWLETFVKVFLPAGGAITFDPDVAIQTGDSDTVRFVANREMAEIWRSYTGSTSGGQEYGQRVMEFDKDFGTYVQFPFAPVTDNTDAPPLTFEMQKIEADMPDTYNRYGDLWKYVMPQGDPYGSIFDDQRLSQYREAQQQSGYRKALTPARVAEIQYQYMLGGAMMQRLDEAERMNPGDGAAKQKIRDEAYAQGYKQELTLDQARQRAEEITNMLEDEEARDAVPGGDMIFAYLQARRAKIDQLQTQWDADGSRSGTLDTQESFWDARALDDIARRYQAADTSGSFTRFWETVGRVELGENADLVEETR